MLSKCIAVRINNTVDVKSVVAQVTTMQQQWYLVLRTETVYGENKKFPLC